MKAQAPTLYIYAKRVTISYRRQQLYVALKQRRSPAQKQIQTNSDATTNISGRRVT